MPDDSANGLVVRKNRRSILVVKPAVGLALAGACVLLVPDAWAGKPKGGLTDDEVISQEALLEEMRGAEPPLILDARSLRSYEEEHIEGAKMPLSDEYYREEKLFAAGAVRKLPDRARALADGMSRYPKHTKIVTYCHDDCQAGAVLLFDLKRLGYERVRSLEEGFQTWKKKGYPTASA